MSGWQEKMHANIKRPRIMSPSVSWLRARLKTTTAPLEIMKRLGAHCAPNAHSMALIARQFRNGNSLMTFDDNCHCSHTIEPIRFFGLCWMVLVRNGHAENRAPSELVSPLLLISLTLCR